MLFAHESLKHSIFTYIYHESAQATAICLAFFVTNLPSGGVAAAPATITGAIHCQPFPEERSSVATAAGFCWREFYWL